MNVLTIGTRVKTVPPKIFATDWTPEASAKRKFYVNGLIIRSSDMHGLIYLVRHDDDTEAWYETQELKIAFRPFDKVITFPDNPSRSERGIIVRPYSKDKDGRSGYDWWVEISFVSGEETLTSLEPYRESELTLVQECMNE